MEAVLAPVERFCEALRWFVAAPEVKVLHATCGDSLRESLLEYVVESESSSRNKSPFVLIEAPVEENDDGWALRVDELDEEIVALRESLQTKAPPLVLPPVRRYDNSAVPVAQFASLATALVAAVPPPLEGLVVVLAPMIVANPQLLMDQLKALLARPELAKVRWIVLEPESDPPRTSSPLGPAATFVDATIDEDAAKRDLSAMIAGLASAPAGATGARAVGMAGPREAPPPRKNDAPSASPEERKAILESAGIAPGFADAEGMRSLRLSLLSASESMQRGDTTAAIKHQGAARDTAAKLGLPREATLMEMLVGTYALQAGATERAIGIFADVATKARAGGFSDLGVQAHLSRGSALLLAGRQLDAASAYLEAAQLAESMGPPGFVLAIEGYRMGGQVLLDLKREQQGIAAWRKAIALSDEMPANERSETSAADVATTLAKVCRKHGLLAQAASLEEKAKQIKSGATTEVKS